VRERRPLELAFVARLVAHAFVARERQTFACSCRKVEGRGGRGDEGGEGVRLIKGNIREVCAKMSHKTTNHRIVETDALY
jgi:hypothetical protein